MPHKRRIAPESLEAATESLEAVLQCSNASRHLIMQHPALLERLAQRHGCCARGGRWAREAELLSLLPPRNASGTEHHRRELQRTDGCDVDLYNDSEHDSIYNDLFLDYM